MGSLDQVRTFMSEWCAQPRLDLNNMALFDGAARHKMLNFRPQFQASSAGLNSTMPAPIGRSSFNPSSVFACILASAEAA